MAARTKTWDDFVEYLTDWCKRESNDVSIKFSCELLEEKCAVRIIHYNSELNKKVKLIFTRENYLKLSPGHEYSVICSNITQTLKDKFRWNSKRRYYKTS